MDSDSHLMPNVFVKAVCIEGGPSVAIPARAQYSAGRVGSESCATLIDLDLSTPFCLCCLLRAADIQRQLTSSE
jgi:hypothetical protein